MGESRVHSCVYQRGVIAGRFEPDPQRKCSCRKVVTLTRAIELVEDGAASWMVLGREKKEQEKPCAVCGGTDLKNSCNACAKTGKTYVKLPDVLSRRDIVSAVHRTKTNRNSTPRVPTIEAKHIYRALASDDEKQEYAQERIQEYGRMVALNFQELGAEVEIRITGKADKGQRIIHPGKPEPVGGREHDWGRAI